MLLSGYQSYDKYIEQQDEQNYKNCEEYHKCRNCEGYHVCRYFQNYHYYKSSYQNYQAAYAYQKVQKTKWCLDCRDKKSCKSIVINKSKYIDDVLRKCDKYIRNITYVYKLCNNISILDNSRRWLVILQKTDDTKTNELRFDVSDKNFAKFRANKLKVIEIIDIYNPDYSKTIIINTFDSVHKKKYEVDKIVESDAYDDDINCVCSDGIHYFKTPLPACYYRDVPKNYTGNWATWYDNGQKQLQGEYINGEQSGKWIEMNYDGNIYREYNFT
jgi:hypothetical protein